MGLFRKIEEWWEFCLSSEKCALRGNEIVFGRGNRPDRHLRAEDVNAWQIHRQVNRTSILINLVDGRVFHWVDTDGNLASILRRVAPKRELPVAKIDPRRPEVKPRRLTGRQIL